ncbi:glycosyltransferase family 39 protein [Candidatus Kaiserbacteria bacterium]|nr:glycosyltransferase family 39 protein [Candidatus Kaiserbacteria bacterium]
MLNQHESRKKYSFAIVFILIIAYFISGWYFAFIETKTFDETYGFPVLNGGDSLQYALLAEHLIEFKAYTSSETSPYVPEILRSPGYSFFLTPFKYIFDSFVPVIFAQALLVIISALIIYDIGRKLFSEKIGVGAALIFGLEPSTIFYTFTILSDILFVFLFLTAIYILFFCIQPSLSRLYGYTFLGMLLLGYATLVRPSGLYSIGIILFFIMIHYIKSIGLKKTVILTLFSAVIYASVLTPWYIRNHKYSGAYTLSPIGPYTILFYNVAGFLGYKSGTNADKVKEELRREEFPNADIQTLQSGRYTKQITNAAVKYVSADPVGYFLYHGLGSINFFIASSLKDVSNESLVFRKFLFSTLLLNKNNVSIKEYLNEGGILKGAFTLFKTEPLFTFERLAWLFLSILALIAPILFWKVPEKRVQILLFFFLTVYFALIFGPVSYPRYRIAAEPLLMLLAGGSTWLLYPILQRGVSRLKLLIRSATNFYLRHKQM